MGAYLPPVSNLYRCKMLSALSILAMYLLLPSLAEKLPEAGSYTSEVEIAEGSYLVLRGNTNVNQFRCSFEKPIYGDTLAVRWSEKEGQVFFEGAILNLNVDQFECGNRMMNKDFQQLLMAEDFPFITIELRSANLSDSVEMPFSLSQMDAHSLLTGLNITVAGAKKQYAVPVTVNSKKGSYTYSGALSIDITDFGLTPPSRLLGMIVVEEKIEIAFYIKTRIISYKMQ